MKPYIDMFLTVQNEFLTSRKMKSRLLNHWGTTTIDGVKVFNKRLIVWHKNTPNLADTNRISKILTMFGAKKAIKEAKFEGIKYYYFYFNKMKWKEPNDLDHSLLCNKINSFIHLNTPFSVYLNVTENTEDNIYKDWTSSQVESYMMTNWSSLVKEKVLDVVVNGIAEEVVSTYVLFDNNGLFNVKILSSSVVGSPVYASDGIRFKTNSERIITGYRTNISLELEVTRIANIYPASTMFKNLLDEKDKYRSNLISYLEVSDINYESISDAINSIDIKASNDEIWYKGHIRVDAADSNYLRRNLFTKLITSTIDTGYKKKEKKKKGGFLGKLISIVIIVIAIVITVMSGGTLSPVAFAMSLAANLGIASLVITGISFVMSSAGYDGAASFMGKVARIAGIVSVIAGIGATVQSFARNAAQTAANQSLLESAQQVGKWALDQVTSSWTKALSVASKIVDSVTSRTYNNKVEKLESRLSDAEDILTQQEKELASIYDKEYHICVEDIKFYTKQLTDDNLQFETNYLYEGTRMNVGRPSFFPYGLNTRMKFNEYSGKFE